MRKVEVLSPAGGLASLKAAVTSGADAVYLGLGDSTNVRNFEGLNFTPATLAVGIEYAHARGVKVYFAVNTFAQGDTLDRWRRAVDTAVDLGADALILADLGVLEYASRTHPDAEIHLSVQASASNYESINFFKRHFNIKRVVLPRVLTTGEIKRLAAETDVDPEVFILGTLCINVEGRCYLSSFVTGSSTNTDGACSPSRFVRFDNETNGKLSIALGGMVLNELGPGECSPYPTCCKGRYADPDGRVYYAIEDPESLNALELLPELIEAGVVSLKIEGRQRTKSYAAAMTSVVRQAVDSYYADPGSYQVRAEWAEKTLTAFEGSSQTVGCYAGK